MCGPMCPRPILRKAPAAPADEVGAEEAPEAAEEAGADGPIPAAAADFNRYGVSVACLSGTEEQAGG